MRAAGHRHTGGSPRAIAEATMAVIADFAHRHATGTRAVVLVGVSEMVPVTSPVPA